jgi:hypothetical protein
MLVGASYISLFHSIETSSFAYPATDSADKSVLFWGQIGGGVVKTTDLQQASRTVGKSFLATLCEHLRFNLNCPLEMLWNQGECCDGFTVPAYGFCFPSV